MSGVGRIRVPRQRKPRRAAPGSKKCTPTPSRGAGRVSSWWRGGEMGGQVSARPSGHNRRRRHRRAHSHPPKAGPRARCLLPPARCCFSPLPHNEAGNADDNLILSYRQIKSYSSLLTLMNPVKLVSVFSVISDLVVNVS